MPIFLQGDPATHVFSLVTGTARLTHLLPDGRRAAVGFRFPGDMMGLTTDAAYPLGAETLTDGTLCRIERTLLDDLLRRHPELGHRVLDLCARELAATQEQLTALNRFTAEERVAAFLVSLAEAHACRGRRGKVLDLPATRADVGELLGLTFETVSRVFSAFRRRGWIRLHAQSGVELVEAAALGALARGDGVESGRATRPGA
jgi:CRP/FNR family transcriptional regulator